MTPEKAEEFRSDIEDVIAKHAGSIPTSWVLVHEGVYPDGNRMLSLLLSPDMRVWTALGLLEYVKADIYSYVNG